MKIYAREFADQTTRIEVHYGTRDGEWNAFWPEIFAAVFGREFVGPEMEFEIPGGMVAAPRMKVAGLQTRQAKFVTDESIADTLRARHKAELAEFAGAIVERIREGCAANGNRGSGIYTDHAIMESISEEIVDAIHALCARRGIEPGETKPTERGEK